MDISWYKPRNYLHFDSPITLQQAIKLVANPNNVVKHSFYPFLSYTLSVAKIKKDKNEGKLVRLIKIEEYLIHLIKIAIFLVIMHIY